MEDLKNDYVTKNIMKGPNYEKFINNTTLQEFLVIYLKDMCFSAEKIDNLEKKVEQLENIIKLHSQDINYNLVRKNDFKKLKEKYKKLIYDLAIRK